MLNTPATKPLSNNLPTPRPGPAPAPFQAVPPASKPIAANDPAAPTGTSVIGDDLTILGEKITIVSQNALRVDGHVHGDVHGKQVIISKGGSVDGKVRAERIEVRGDVSGSIIAVSIALHETAKVEGDIMHQKLSISEGAEFDGRVQLIRDTSELTPILDAEVIARQTGTTQPQKQPDFGSLQNETS